MSGIKMIMGNRHVRSRARLASFDCNIVIACTYVGLSNGDVCGRRRIDAIGVAGSRRGVNPDRPGRKPI